MRIGTGYDVHAFSPERKLILAGVHIPYKMGLLGHSDADVLSHAIGDAILGALCLGSLGDHFPDTDPKFKDISSLILLEKITALMQEQKYIIQNIDSVVIAEEPKLAPYILEMRQNIAKSLQTNLDKVSIKATTTEKLGFTGRKEGIAAQASILLIPKA
ncbi:2-C-methyl-D-erythritol 2,4-cyclodiphosphate synthase [Candidatus Margulisiibacteriota bacterium]